MRVNKWDRIFILGGTIPLMCSAFFQIPVKFLLFLFLSRRGDTSFPRKEDGTLLYDNIDYKLTWAAMEKLVGKGFVRAIGLSNFNSRQIDDILSVASIKPTVLQVRRKCDVIINVVHYISWVCRVTIVFCRWSPIHTLHRLSCWLTAGIEVWWWPPTVRWDLLTEPGSIQRSLCCWKNQPLLH